MDSKPTPTTVTCSVCGYTWIPRKAEVVRCANPDCRSPYWWRKRQAKG